MKTKLIFFTIIIVIISLKVTFAESDSLEFKKSIVNKIIYPEFAMKDKLAADVWVKFTVNENGKIIVDQINCVDVVFLDYVKTELQQIFIDKESDLIGKTFYYKFTFKYQ